MKTIFVTIAILFVGMAANINAKTVTTYYGTKASSSADNPCKGATTRVCGKIESDFIVVSEDLTKIEETLLDENGIVISKKDYLVEKSLDEAIEYSKFKNEYSNSELESNLE